MQKFGPDFDQLPDLTANNFGVEQDMVNRKSALKTTDTPLGDSVTSYTLVANKKLLTVVLTHPK